MAAASGSTGGPTPSPPPSQRSSPSLRPDRSLLTGKPPESSEQDALLQVSADLSAAADPPKGHDCPDGSSPESNSAPNGQGPNPNRKPSYATTVTSGKSSRPPPAFVTNLTAFHPVKRGNASFLKMPEDLYQRRLSAFTFALIGRIFLPKQSTPRPLPDLKSELQQLFKTEQDWSLTPLGKGFYSLKFSSHDDQVRASKFNSWKLKLGSFFIREWKPNFDPYKEQTSITQLWVRLFHLPEEYWDPNFLVGIFRAVGNVVKLDGSTAAGTVGHFARALVEVDLSYPLAESVTIEGCASTFVVEFGFENLPLYCSFCRYIGHSIVDCKSKKRKDDPDLTKDNATAKDPAATAKQPAATTRHNARSRKEQAKEDPPAVPTNNAFTANAKDREWQLKENAKPVEAAPKQKSAPVSTSNAFAALENESSCDPSVAAAATTARELVPLSAEAAAALKSIAGRDYTLHTPETENVLPSDDEGEEEIQADPKVADSQPESSELAEGMELPPKEMPSTMDETTTVDPPDNTSSELTLNAAGLELSPKESAMPSKTTPTDMDETTMVVPSRGQVAGHKMSAAAKRRTKEALRKGRVRSSMKTRSSFDISSDTLHVLADKRGKSAQVSAASVGLPHGAKQSQLEDKIRTAMEQGKCPKAYVVDTGQPVKAMGFTGHCCH